MRHTETVTCPACLGDNTCQRAAKLGAETWCHDCGAVQRQRYATRDEVAAMARSHATWVVLHRETGDSIAAFTVRHELVTWLGRRDDDPGDLRIWRCGDGPWQDKPTRVTVVELLERRVDSSEKGEIGDPEAV